MESTLDLEYHIASILDLLVKEADDNPHLQDTPKRVAKSLVELTTPIAFDFTTFRNHDIDQMITIKDIPFYSLCAHHLLPFYGKAHIAYIPDELMAGLSKLSRTVEHFMRGLNVQEELTKDIMDYLVEHLDPLGAMVVLEGKHLCMEMRGAQTNGSSTMTSALYGVFLDPSKGARQEFLELIRG